MNDLTMRNSLVVCVVTLLAVLPMAAQSTESSEVQALRALLTEQQKQIDQLKLALEDQKKLIERSMNAAPPAEKRDFALPRPKTLGEVASTTPYIPAAPVPTALAMPVTNAAQAPNSASANPCEANPGPLLRLYG